MRKKSQYPWKRANYDVLVRIYIAHWSDIPRIIYELVFPFLGTLCINGLKRHKLCQSCCDINFALHMVHINTVQAMEIHNQTMQIVPDFGYGVINS